MFIFYDIHVYLVHGTMYAGYLKPSKAMFSLWGVAAGPGLLVGQRLAAESLQSVDGHSRIPPTAAQRRWVRWVTGDDVVNMTFW